jgi:hypothetical protein
MAALTIDPWTAKLTISKDDKVVATGSYDAAAKLIKIDKQPEVSNIAKADDWTTVLRWCGNDQKDFESELRHFPQKPI